MVYERKGYRYGAWVIRLGDRRLIVEGRGDRSFPAIDRLYVPKRGVSNPSTWDDYENELVPDAGEQLSSLLQRCGERSPWRD